MHGGVALRTTNASVPELHKHMATRRSCKTYESLPDLQTKYEYLPELHQHNAT